MPGIRQHDLQHTYATVLLARGTHPTYVQRSLGHASVTLALDVYSRWMPSMSRDTVSAIGVALKDPQTAAEALWRRVQRVHPALVSEEVSKAPEANRRLRSYDLFRLPTRKNESRRADSNR